MQKNHCKPCTFGCKVRFTSKQMVAHVKICKKRASNWHEANEKGEKAEVETVEECILDHSFDFDAFEKEYTKKLKKDGHL